MHGLEQDIAATITTVWSSMLGVDIICVDPAPSPLDTDTLTIIGCIHLTGPDRYAIALECTESLARLAASVMFDIPASDANALDARDALAELTNVTGGNVKALLPHGHQLSLPTVVEGRDFRATITGARQTGELHFACGTERLTASLFVGRTSTPHDA